MPVLVMPVLVMPVLVMPVLIMPVLVMPVFVMPVLAMHVLAMPSPQVIHIDYGDCFEVTMDRESFPEKADTDPIRM